MRAEVNGVRLFFDVDGAKLRPNGPWLDEVPTVVIVQTDPGSDHTGYKEHIGPHLAAVAQVVYVELRRTGRSDRSSPEHGNVETWSTDLRGLVQRLGIHRPVLLASGVDCPTVLRFAQRWPEELSKLVLSSPTASASSLPDLSGVTTETLVLAAGNDPQHPIAEIVDALPNAHVVQYPESLDLVQEFVA